FHADTLIWQSRIRLGVALVIGVAGLLLLQTGARGSVEGLAGAFAGYALVTGGIAALARRGRIGSWGVTASLLADVAYVCAATLIASPPAYYQRILILAFIALHLADLYFGRTQALIVMAAVILGYLMIVTAAINGGAALVWSEEMWSVAAFGIVAAVFLLEYGSWNRRLGSIMRLLERAEEGEFAAPYDLEADAHPDAVTLLGAAYNRVREQISSMVMTDALTGCVNRRGFDHELAREMARAARANSDFSLLALDLDFFKNVNDTRGHLAGDAVLREVGGLLMASRRAGDIVARTGGEEFSIILPDTGAAGAELAASRFWEAIRAHEFLKEQKSLRLTVSIGAVSRGPDGREELVEALKKRADDALYHAKRDGRDCVRVWTPALSARPSARISESMRQMGP
ncbi:MAG: GGDEF domain-containing protein, partial [Gemmatimonadota bacterium]|nr:GGDEF domain-containing protein [Gemmatimonadota bacterium]